VKTTLWKDWFLISDFYHRVDKKLSSAW
jgi:hypothetical protein